MKEQWPGALLELQVPETIFEKLFESDPAVIVAKVSDNQSRGVPDYPRMTEISSRLNTLYPEAGIMSPAAESYIEISAIPERLLLYDVDPGALYERLRIALNAHQVDVLHSGSQYIPIVIGNSPKGIENLLNELMVENRHQLEIPVKALVNSKIKEDYKILMGDEQGPFVPVSFHTVPTRDVEGLMGDISRKLKDEYKVDTSFAGSFFGSRQLIKELAVVLLIALALLYFILAAQFESLAQPFIILLEIPIAIFGGLIMLWLFGGSINIMSMIGIIVMCGVVINDSILKIDTINHLRLEGMPVFEAIKEGGHRRLKSIIMTALTTVLALMPVIWGSGMGSELQKPLALTVIGGMVIGTLISLYVIPLFYYYLYRNKTVSSQQ
ncbi:MAG: efflux RND transporter permease subunit [Bacteroidales bacterium]|nr:efflux RND transporter permease subunit [Bacteroidales bacterium]